MKDKTIYNENDIINLINNIIEKENKKEYMLKLLDNYSIYSKAGHILNKLRNILKNKNMN